MAKYVRRTRLDNFRSLRRDGHRLLHRDLAQMMSVEFSGPRIFGSTDARKNPLPAPSFRGIWILGKALADISDELHLPQMHAVAN